MNATIRNTYAALRHQGWRARDALWAAKVKTEFDNNKNVRLITRPDEMCSMDDLKGDTFNRAANPEIPESRMAREEKAFEELVEREGVYGLIGEYKCPCCGHWEHGDSCWGFVGNDYGGYEYDIMQATLDALKAKESK